MMILRKVACEIWENSKLEGLSDAAGPYTTLFTLPSPPKRGLVCIYA